MLSLGGSGGTATAEHATDGVADRRADCDTTGKDKNISCESSKWRAGCEPGFSRDENKRTAGLMFMLPCWGKDLRGSRGHLPEETWARALLRRGLHGRSLVLLRVGSSRVRLLLLGCRCRPSRGGGRASRTAAGGGRGGTTALTRHFGCVDVYWRGTGEVVLRERRRVDMLSS